MATILVIDDEASIRNLLREVLEQAGHRVMEANDGREALSLYQKDQADLVIMDLLMPEMSGVETLRRLRQQRSLADLPVIMVTAKTGSDDVVEALEQIPEALPDAVALLLRGGEV